MRLRHPHEVGPGIYMLGTEWVNFYLVLDGSDAILIDAGYSRYDSQLVQALAMLRSSLDAISAVFVTHHHVDHVGTAERARSRGARVLVGKGDAEKITGATKSHPPSGFFKQSWRPMMLRYLVHTAMAGGASYSPVDRLEFITDGQTFDLPGHPGVVLTGGHTKGHFSVHMPERGVLFTGDALVNFDYATGERGPKLHRFNEDRLSARAALDKLGSLEATTLLFGHGAAWHSGVHLAIEQATERNAIGA